MYSLADVAKITAAKRRSIQLWADAGVIRAEAATDRAGTGTHRSFPRDEVIVGCIIAACALDGIPIGKLMKISDLIRHYMFANKLHAAQPYGQGGDFIEELVQDRAKAILVYDQVTLWISGVGEEFASKDGGIAFYVEHGMTGENRKASIIALHLCFHGLRRFDAQGG